MTHSEPKNFIYSKIGVKVYLKPEYHPSLKDTDLSHPDILRKARELFDKRHGRVAGLPKICSENSEDAQTWSYFSPLLSMSPRAKGHWLKVFFEKALGRNLNDDLTRRRARAKTGLEMGFSHVCERCLKLRGVVERRGKVSLDCD